MATVKAVCSSWTFPRRVSRFNFLPVGSVVLLVLLPSSVLCRLFFLSLFGCNSVWLQVTFWSGSSIYPSSTVTHSWRRSKHAYIISVVIFLWKWPDVGSRPRRLKGTCVLIWANKKRRATPYFLPCILKPLAFAPCAVPLRFLTEPSQHWQVDTLLAS